ncbi:MAG: hypothetical protein ACRDE2_04320 [Chitinophagaceae bacterium]
MANENHAEKPTRFLKRLIIILLVIIFILAGGGRYFSKKISPFLARQLKNQVIRSSDSLYSISFKDFSVNLLSGTISIQSFQLIPDTTVYNHLVSEKSAPANMFDLSVSELRLKHAHPFRLLFFHVVKIRSLEFDNPIVKIVHRNVQRSDTIQTVHQVIANLISGPLKAVYVNRVELNNISLSYRNLSDTGSKGLRVHNAQLILKDFFLDAATLKDTSAFFFTQDAWLHLSDITLPTSDSLYYFHVGSASYSTGHERGLLKNISLIPRYNDTAFDNKLKFSQDRFDVSIDTILFSGLSPNDLIKEDVNIHKLSILDPVVDIYLNRGLPNIPHRKPFPQELLHKSPVHFILDTLNIVGATLSYREFNPKSGLIGKVPFNNINGSVYNITNIPFEIEKNNHCRGDLNALFLNKGKIITHFEMNLSDKNDAIAYSGNLGFMKAKALNEILKPLALIKINSGEIHQCRFNFTVDTNAARGTVHILYDDLSVKVLSKDSTTGRLKGRGLISIMANLFVINRGNISDSSNPQNAVVFFKRSPNQSIINLMWNSLFAGIQEIAGIQPQQTQNVINEFKGNKLVQKIRDKQQAKKHQK